MKRLLASALIVGVSTFGVVGCEQKTEDKTVIQKQTPTGKETETITDKVEKTGGAKTNP